VVPTPGDAQLHLDHLRRQSIEATGESCSSLPRFISLISDIAWHSSTSMMLKGTILKRDTLAPDKNRTACLLMSAGGA
jgi:hypothetical protein